MDFVTSIWLTLFLFFFKQKTAYEMRISDWSSDVCSSDLDPHRRPGAIIGQAVPRRKAVDGQVGRKKGRGVGNGLHRCVVGRDIQQEIGRASCRERVCQYV